MSTGDIAFIIAVATFVGGSLVGLAQLRKSGDEARKTAADATSVIIGASALVVKQLREQIDDLAVRLDESESRILHLETSVSTWENWADRVLAVLDKSFSMLGVEQADRVDDDIKKIKRARPRRAKVEDTDDRQDSSSK
jgi:hypothetical protein